MTKTVDGMCADCWGVKDPARARKWLTRPRTRALFDRPIFDFVDPLNVLWFVAGGVAVVLILVFAASGWI